MNIRRKKDYLFYQTLNMLLMSLLLIYKLYNIKLINEEIKY